MSKLRHGALEAERPRKAAATLTSAAHLGAMLTASLPQARRAPPQPTWPVSEEQRGRVRIKWPGEYAWAPAERWLHALQCEISRLVEVCVDDVPQRYEQVALLEVELDGRSHSVAIDFSDSALIEPDVRERCALVFKLQYARSGYGSPAIVPGGYVAVAGRIYRYLPALRRIKDRSQPHHDVYGRFSAHRHPARTRALEILKAQDRFGFQGGGSLASYPVFLREAALSRICVDLPGGGDFCFRLVDYLAIGCCVVRTRPVNQLHVPLEDGRSVRFVSPDLSGLVDVCAELLADDEQRMRLQRGAREHFDRYLRTTQLAGYYVDRCLSLLASD